MNLIATGINGMILGAAAVLLFVAFCLTAPRLAIVFVLICLIARLFQGRHPFSKAAKLLPL